ncbi:MAG: galactokinase [Mycobacteriales bacterium]
MNDVTVTAADAFAAAFATSPDGVWAAPGRVNLIGEHTDYNDGFVLPFGIDKRATVAVAARDGDEIRISSRQRGLATVLLDEIGPGQVTGWAAYVAGPIWALEAEGVPRRGLDIFLDSDVAPGSGLSSSAALECAVAIAVAELGGADIDRARLALAAQRAEVEVVGMPCGVMDQMASMLARESHALFLDTRSLKAEHIPLPLTTAGRALMVIDTKAPHRHTDGFYAERQAACHRAAEVLGVAALRDVSLADVDASAEALGEVGHRRARHVVTENARVIEVIELLRAKRLDAIGPLMTASHESLRDDFEVTVPELDVAVEAALVAGAFGARMTGGGFGGSIIALVDADRAGEVFDTVRAAFARESFQEPQWFLAVPSQGAERLA